MFQTSNIHLTAYLMALDHSFEGISGPKDRRTFHFSGVTSDAVAAFYTDGQAPARRLFEAYKSIRRLMFTTA
jgi:hypothetical protein